MVVESEIRNWMIEAMKEGRVNDVPEHLREKVRERCGKAVRPAPTKTTNPFHAVKPQEPAE